MWHCRYCLLHLLFKFILPSWTAKLHRINIKSRSLSGSPAVTSVGLPPADRSEFPILSVAVWIYLFKSIEIPLLEIFVISEFCFCGLKRDSSHLPQKSDFTFLFFTLVLCWLKKCCVALYIVLEKQEQYGLKISCSSDLRGSNLIQCLRDSLKIE